MNKRTIILNFGHGSINPFTQEYLPKGEKLYHFKNSNFTIYEGERNRVIGDKLANLFKDNNWPTFIINHPYLDTPLNTRVELANKIHEVQKDCIGIEIHNNAISKSIAGNGSDARGTEGWTSPGPTESDKIMEYQFDAIKRILPNRKLRTDRFRDGDSDKEKLLYMTKNTHCPWLLWEVAFFDNWQDAMLLMDEDFLNDFARAIYQGTVQYCLDNG